MILIDGSYHPFFKEFSKYLYRYCVRRFADQQIEISTDYTKKGTWILNYGSYLTKIHHQVNQYIAVQTENLSVKGVPGYMDFLSGAKEVWDSSSVGTSFRIGYSKVWRLQMEEAKDIDILFYGSLNNTREKIINQIENVTNVKVTIVPIGCYGADVMKYIMRSKIVLSIHYHPNPLNDMARIAPLLSNKVFVIAQSGVDPWFNNLTDIVIGDVDSIPQLCKQYLVDPERRIQMIDKGFEWIKTIEYDSFI